MNNLQNNVSREIKIDTYAWNDIGFVETSHTNTHTKENKKWPTDRSFKRKKKK